MTSWLGVVVFISTFLCSWCSIHTINTRFAEKKDPVAPAPARWEIFTQAPETVMTLPGKNKKQVKLQLKMTDHYLRENAGDPNHGGAAQPEGDEKANYVDLSVRIKEFFVKHYSTMELMEKKVTSSDKDEVSNGWTVLTINGFRTLRFKVTAADDPRLAEIFAGCQWMRNGRPLIVTFSRVDVNGDQEWTMDHCGPFGEEVEERMNDAIAAKAELDARAAQAARDAQDDRDAARERGAIVSAWSKPNEPRPPVLKRKRRSTEPVTDLSAKLQITDADPNSDFVITRIEFKEFYGDNEETHFIDFEKEALVEDPNSSGSELTADFVEEDTTPEPVTTIKIVLKPRGN